MAIDEFKLSRYQRSTSRCWKSAMEAITIDTEDEAIWRLQQYFGEEDTYTLKRLAHVVSRMVDYGGYRYTTWK